MKQVSLSAKDVDGARDEVLEILRKRNTTTAITNIIYYFGWNGFGVAAVLSSIAQALQSMKDPPPGLQFSRIVYIDCSMWKSKRVMQRKIAEELKLDHNTMAMFDEQDEEDDFRGVDLGSRDVIASVAAEIDQTLREGPFILIFLNGSEDDFDMSGFGVPKYHKCGVIIWAFRTRLLTMKIGEGHLDDILSKVRYAELILISSKLFRDLGSSQFIALLREEAARIVARYPCLREDMDLASVVDCCLYRLSLHCYYYPGSPIGLDWLLAHATRYWICDGIIQGERGWEISNTLHPEISFEFDANLPSWSFIQELREDQKIPFLVVRDVDYVDKKMPHYSWIYLSLKNKKVNENMQRIMVGASSIFLAFETKADNLCRLPNGFFNGCNNLSVLVLSCCAFSFVSPPFLHCSTLRFLGLDHCTDDNVVVQGGATCTTKWACLQSLWVIDLYYTDCAKILLSDKNIDLVYNLIELNMEGVRCSWLASQLPKRLPCSLQRLRIIKPIPCEEGQTSSPNADMMSGSFVDIEKLEVLDLSGNKEMKNLPTSISKASSLQVLILDGCDELENVDVLPPSLRSFSFDGYGTATSYRASNIELPSESCRQKPPPEASKKKDIKTTMISLEGCIQLENLFLRGLSNLVELDLSGCAIKVLDFGAMVVDVPGLRRLFLLGCEHLRAINWGSGDKKQARLLELLCVDTRPGWVLEGDPRPLLRTQDKSFRQQVHAVTADARLLRSMLAPIYFYFYNRSDIYFNIKITSSTACSDRIVHREAPTRSGKEMTESYGGEQRRQRHNVVASPNPYGDVFISGAGDAPTPMDDFPQPPSRLLDRHVEIGDGSRSVQSEAEADAYGSGGNLSKLIANYTQSLHVHDVSTCSSIMGEARMYSLRWCRVERCSNLHAVFPTGTIDNGCLETIWASDLLRAHHIWGKSLLYSYTFAGLRHLHLRSCPSLQFAVPVPRLRPSFPSLETLHIIHCGDLRHVFELDDKANHTRVEFLRLTTIHLHDLPSLRQICEAPVMLAPALETVRVRGCWSLRRLPALKPSMRRKPSVEVEKDVWDALEWDGVDAGHHPSLYQPPLHCRHYRRPRMLKGTVLR